MTTTMTEALGDIRLHRVPGDPLRTRIRDSMREGASIRDAASQLGIDEDAAMAALGIRIEVAPWVWDRGLGGHTSSMRVVPDGVRACFDGECPHGPDYVASPADGGQIHD